MSIYKLLLKINFPTKIPKAYLTIDFTVLIERILKYTLFIKTYLNRIKALVENPIIKAYTATITPTS